MKIVNSFFKSFVLLLCVAVVFSCDDDLNTIGSDIIGDPNFNFLLMDDSSVLAYSRAANPVQTNNLQTYQLGVYKDPVYGITESSVLAQLTLDEVNPDFGINPVIDSVYLNIPYFSTSTSAAGDAPAFTLESVFGDTPFKLSVYRSNFFLRDLDPDSGFTEPQKYYSNQGPLFRGFLGELIKTEEEFKPSDETVGIGSEKFPPRLRMALPISFFEENILNQEGQDVLLNNENFKNHIRGLYFIAEAINGDGTMIIFNINQAGIQMYYTQDNTAEPVPGEEYEPRLPRVLDFSFSGVNVNTFEGTIPPSIQDKLNNPNLAGEENLFLKGGAGAISIIELFGPDADGNGIADELEVLRNRKILINEANLTFQVNQNMVNGPSTEPERIFIYDLDNNRVLVDYALDNLTSPSDPLNFKTNHLGRLERDASENGVSYKIRITNHVSNLIKRDSTNVRLGLAITQNVNIVDALSLQNITPPGFDKVPAGNVISPQGTVLYGSHPADQTKKIKFNIYYTEIDN